jgi:UDP-glucose 4-epimerase
MHIARERILAHTCQQAKVPMAIVRPCAIYGPSDTHNSYGPNRFLRSALNTGKISLFGAGPERRHHVYVEDVAELIRLCIAHASTGVINAVTGRAISFGEAASLISQMISAITGGNVAIENLPGASTVTHRHFDTRALALAFPAFRVTAIKDGLQRTYKAMCSGGAVNPASGLAALSGANSPVPDHIQKEESVCPQP